MRIKEINGYALSSPYGDGKNFGQPLGVKSIGIVEVFTDEGHIGIGETYSGVYSPEIITPVIDFLKPILIGKSALDLEKINKLLEIPFIAQNGFIKSVLSAIDIALWDIKGQFFQKPIAHLLNDELKNKVRVYSSGGSVAMTPEQISMDSNDALNHGFKAYKMRVGFQNWKTDLKRVEAARNVLSEDKELMIDAIMGTLNKWDLQKATICEKELSQYNITWLEEPLPPVNFINYKKLNKVANCKIALGESFTSKNEFESYMINQCLNIVQPDITHCGGYSAALKVISLAKKCNIPIAMHVWGSPLSLLANMHFSLAFNEVKWLEIPRVNLSLLSQEIQKLFEIKDGFLSAELRPGLGLGLNEKIKNKYSFIPGSGYKVPN